MFVTKIRLYLMLCMVVIFTISSCKHEPIVPPVSDTKTISQECNQDTVYFVNTILPIFKSNCATAGCHDAATKKDGYDLSSFNGIVNKGIRPGRPDNSDIYEVIEKNEMPPYGPLSNDAKDAIRKWILQGAKNNECIGCDTSDVKYSNAVKPILDQNCVSCHSGSSPSGGFALDTYDNVKPWAENAMLYNAVAHINGASPMPKGGNKLDDCKIRKIKKWIDAGYPNN